LVGNFPQALSHIALVNSAHNLVLSENALKQRAGHHPQSDSKTPSAQEPSAKSPSKAT